jgi:hypothetical protein
VAMAMKKRKQYSQTNLNTKRIFSLRTHFPFPTPWVEMRIHQLFLTYTDLLKEYETLKLEHNTQRKQITALAKAINVLLEENKVAQSQ